MALVDLFFPDNPERRYEVVRLSSKLVTLLESNFKQTNDLIDCVHKYIPGKQFRKIKVDMNETVKENCIVIQERLQEIQAFIEEKAESIQSKIDSSMYDTLMSPDTKFIDRVCLARNVAKAVDLGGVGSVLLTALIKRRDILANIVAKIRPLMTSVTACVAMGVLVLGLSAIISAILGYIERSKLEKAIMELEDAIKTFEPASDTFNREIVRIIIRIEEDFESNS